MIKNFILMCVFLVGCLEIPVEVCDDENAGGNESGGSGGSSSTAGNSGGSSDSSTVSTGGSNVCVPKTCLTYAVEHGGTNSCEIIDDGCGNFVDCGECPVDGTACGKSYRNPDLQHTWQDPPLGVPNVCGGGCLAVRQGDSNHRTCLNHVEYGDRDIFVACTGPAKGDAPYQILNNCVGVIGEEYPNVHWCCERSDSL